MDLTVKRILNILTEEESRSSVVYLNEVEVPAGAIIKIDKKKVKVPWDSLIAFVDRVPQANWGHSCRYIILSIEDKQFLSIEAQFPPYLKSIPETLRLIWKGERVPDWALVIEK